MTRGRKKDPDPVWDQIRRDVERGDGTISDIARRYKKNRTTIQARKRSEGWRVLSKASARGRKKKRQAAPKQTKAVTPSMAVIEGGKLDEPPPDKPISNEELEKLHKTIAAMSANYETIEESHKMILANIRWHIQIVMQKLMTINEGGTEAEANRARAKVMVLIAKAKLLNDLSNASSKTIMTERLTYAPEIEARNDVEAEAREEKTRHRRHRLLEQHLKSAEKAKADAKKKKAK